MLVAELGAMVAVGVTDLAGALLGQRWEPRTSRPARCARSTGWRNCSTTCAASGPARSGESGSGCRDRSSSPPGVRSRAADHARTAGRPGPPPPSAVATIARVWPATTRSPTWPGEATGFGLAEHAPDLVFVKVGTGIGAGLISGGRLHSWRPGVRRRHRPRRGARRPRAALAAAATSAVSKRSRAVAP